jgi:hypothetical protein
MNQSNTIVVISRHQKDVSWTQELVHEGYYVIVYDHIIHNKHPYFVPKNMGREASVYIKHIINYYKHLSPYTVFLQDSNKSWHHKGSIVGLIKDFQEEQITSKKKLKYYNFNDVCLGYIKENNLWPQMQYFFQMFLAPYIGDIAGYKEFTPGHKCCAQFVVHRDLILKYPLKMYEDIYNKYLMNDDTEFIKQHNEKVKGHLMEWTWHLIFNNPFGMRNMTKKEYKKDRKYAIKNGTNGPLF